MPSSPMVARELRIAPVMTGGTSLAVWMGGVTAELFALARSTDAEQPGGTADIYRRLLGLTETTPCVDVVTGTSAGGLNGALLATAVCLRLDQSTFNKLYEIWMRTADLEKLLRPASERDAPSLLQGDSYFLTELQTVIENWVQKHKGSSAFDAIDLVTTYTAVNPIQRHNVDDFGEELNEFTYAGTLRFTDDDFRKQGDIAKRLAIASRTSASIPGVFEPSFLPSDESQAKATDRPNFSHHQPVHVRGIGRWAVDGGVVVNLPLTEALDRIFAREARTMVRRVILYVCPTPSGRAAPESDDPTDMPSIRKSALTAVSAPLAEGIAGDLAEIRRHNRAVAHQRDLRRILGRFLDQFDRELEEPAGGPCRPLYDTYRDRRTESSIDFVIQRLREANPELVTDEPKFRRQLRRNRWRLLPRSINELEGGGRSWGWGIAPIEEAASVVLGLINRALALNVIRPADEATVRQDRTFYFAAQRAEELQAIKARVHQHLEVVREIRVIDEKYWRAVAGTLREHQDPYVSWPFVRGGELPENQALDKPSKVFHALRTAHRALARELIAARPTIRRVALDAGAKEPTTSPGDDPAVGPETATATDRDIEAQAVLCELYALAPITDVNVVQHRLLVYHVTATLLLDDVVPREQPSELMQVSWNAPNQLDDDRNANDKLVGPELSRLGAFLKPSWRANDWFWGRMDGAARLARLLLEPMRLYELGVSSTEVIEMLNLDPEQLDGELDFLDAKADDEQSRRAAEQAQLTKTCQQVSRQLQLTIAREELPQLADAIERTEELGGDTKGARRLAADIRAAFAAPGAPATVPDDTIVKLVKANEIGKETMTTELGSDLSVRLLTRGLGVSVNAATGAHSGLGAAARFLRPVRGPLQLVNSFIGVLTGRSPLARAITVFLLAVAGAILAVRLSGVSINPVLVAAATIVYVGALVLGLWRGGWRWKILGWAVAAAIIGLAVLGDDLSDLVYTGAEPSETPALPAGTTLNADENTTIRITRTVDGEQLIEDIRLDAGASATLSSGRVTAEINPVEQDTDWKVKGFTEGWAGWSVFRIAAAVVTVLALFVLAWRAWTAHVRGDGAKVAWRWPAGVAVVGIVLVLFSNRMWQHVLTGDRPAEDLWKSDGVKGFLVATAELLADWHLAVLIVVLVGAGVVLGIGRDWFRSEWTRLTSAPPTPPGDGGRN